MGFVDNLQFKMLDWTYIITSLQFPHHTNISGEKKYMSVNKIIGAYILKEYSEIESHLMNLMVKQNKEMYNAEDKWRPFQGG